MRGVLVGIAVFAFASDAFSHQDDTPASVAPPIALTINPEARVSVAMAGALPPLVPCGTLEVPVRIANQGFVTAGLEATLVNAPAGVTLRLDPQPLKGVPEEVRMLRL